MGDFYIYNLYCPRSLKSFADMLKLRCLWKNWSLLKATTDLRFVQAATAFFPRSKQRDKTDRPTSGIVYKINCGQCNFAYYGQTQRSLKIGVSKTQKDYIEFRPKFQSCEPGPPIPSSCRCTLTMLRSSDMSQITINGFSLKLGRLWKIWTLGITTSSP